MKALLISANTEQFNMLDLMFEMDTNAVLKKAIKKFRPECIGVSVRNIDDQNIETRKFLLDKVKEVVTLCREQVNVPIVLGGAGYTMFPENVLAYLGADMGIEGEGEIAFPSLLAQLENNSDLSGRTNRGLHSATFRTFRGHHT